jgi:hypothetical protein
MKSLTNNIVISLIILLALIIWGVWKFDKMTDGPNPTLATWNLEITESELEEIITEIKKEAPILHPKSTWWSFTKPRNPKSLGFDFYYPETKEIVSVGAYPTENSDFVTLRLFSVSDSTMSNRKEISIYGELGIFGTFKQMYRFNQIIGTRINNKIEEKRGT